MRNRPTWNTRFQAKPCLQTKVINLVNDTVDIIFKLWTVFFDFSVVLQKFFNFFKALHQWIDSKSTGFHPLNHAHLSGRRHGTHLTPGVSEKVQGTRCGNRTIELTQRACSCITRVHISGFSLEFHAFIQILKRCVAHINLTANFHDVRNIITRQNRWNVRNRLGILGHILTRSAIATRCSSHQFAMLIAKRKRQTVDLWLCG